MAVDAAHIYWAASTNVSDGNGAIWGAGLDGSNPQAVVSGQNTANGVAVDGTSVYWASSENDNGDPAPSGEPTSTGPVPTG